MILKTLGGKEYDLNNADIKTLSVDIESPNIISTYSDSEGKKGMNDEGAVFGPRKISVRYLIESSTRDTFGLLRDEIFDLLTSLEPFYLIEKRIQGKSWKVRVDGQFEIPQNNVYGEFEVTFNAFEGVAKSVGKTQDIQREGIMIGNKWGYGMGLETVDDSELIYNHTGNKFKIFNAGNVEVHPFEDYLKLEIKGAVGSTSSLTIINRTNGTHFKVTKAVASSETWLVDGPVIKRNSLMAAKDTDKNFISLVPGWNSFDVLGASSITISFDFIFLYK